MEDKEVGDLWRAELDKLGKIRENGGDVWSTPMIRLIRKLVIERGKFYAKHHPSESWITQEQGEQKAINDFGIDYKTKVWF
jgi:succinate dehydrogenase/fumarate reductase-like Fe-S protein